MDILEQHLEQHDPASTVRVKNDDGTRGIVIEEAEIVDCDADDPLSGECISFISTIRNDNDGRAAGTGSRAEFSCERVRSYVQGDAVDDEGLRYQEALAYRVVRVNEAEETELELPIDRTGGDRAVQVLTSPINGQFYVIGDANDVFAAAQTSRSLSPRNNPVRIDGPRNTVSTVKKRDDRRRATHNEVERRRRDKINNWIAKLGKIIPECNGTALNGNGNGSGSGGEGKANYETRSKGGILAKACEYIGELRAANQGMGQCLRENEKLRHEVAALKQMIVQLKRENGQLRTSVPTGIAQVSDPSRLKS